jgi:TonB family protein
MDLEEQTIRADRSEYIRKAIIFVLSAALHIGGFSFLLHVKYTYKIYKYPVRGTAVVVVPEGANPVPRFKSGLQAEQEIRETGPIKPGRAETEEEKAARIRAQAGGAPRGQAAAGQGVPAGQGPGGSGGGSGTAGGALPGASAPGFKLVYRIGKILDLAKIKSDPIEDLKRPERYQARRDINFSKYISPNPFRSDAFPPGSGGGGAAGAALAAKGGPVAAVAATPAGGANVPDNVRRFDFRPWANEVAARIQKNWSLMPYGGGSWKGEVGILIMISKAGEILGAEIKVSSNIELLDQVALSSLQTSSPLPPLPADFPNSSLEMYLVFKYGY